MSLLLLLSLIFAPYPQAAYAVDDVRARESTLKAAYLFQLANFVDWPEGRTPEGRPPGGRPPGGRPPGNGGDQPLRLCILGEDPFGSSIDGIAGKKARGRQLVLERFATADGVEGCDVLFISDAESAELADVFELVAGANVLTVGDSKDFARSGGMVGFVVKGGKLRLEVNLDAAQEAGLKISAKLLELSQIVQHRKTGMASRPLGGRGGDSSS